MEIGSRGLVTPSVNGYKGDGMSTENVENEFETSSLLIRGEGVPDNFEVRGGNIFLHHARVSKNQSTTPKKRWGCFASQNP